MWPSHSPLLTSNEGQVLYQHVRQHSLMPAPQHEMSEDLRGIVFISPGRLCSDCPIVHSHYVVLVVLLEIGGGSSWGECRKQLTTLMLKLDVFYNV